MAIHGYYGKWSIFQVPCFFPFGSVKNTKNPNRITPQHRANLRRHATWHMLIKGQTHMRHLVVFIDFSRPRVFETTSGMHWESPRMDGSVVKITMVMIWIGLWDPF